jgi:Bacterial Ig-like domain (group 3)
MSTGIAPISASLPAVPVGQVISATATDTNGDTSEFSADVTVTPHPAPSTTTLTSSPNPSVFGQQVTFTAMVTAAGGTPTGTVDFMEGTTDLTPGGVTLAGGAATFTTASLAVATHTITASYSGDADFLSSQANDASAPQVVQPAASVTVLFGFPNPAVFGQPVLFTAAVRALNPGTGTPTGAVVFEDGSTSIGSLTISGSGRVTFTYSALARGNHAITASYQGDSNFAGSSYANYGETVGRDATTTRVTASVNPVHSGSPVTFTAAVIASAPGSGTPSGTVTFMDFTTALATLTLNAAGTQTFSTSSLTTGMHAITAVYAQSSSFLGSNSPVFAETVTSPLTTLSSTPAAARAINSATTSDAGSRARPASAGADGARLNVPAAHGQVADAASVDRFFAATPPRNLALARAKATSMGQEDWMSAAL